MDYSSDRDDNKKDTCNNNFIGRQHEKFKRVCVPQLGTNMGHGVCTHLSHNTYCTYFTVSMDAQHVTLGPWYYCYDIS